MWENHWMFGGFMWLFWILILVGLFLLVKWIVQQRPGDQNKEEGALKILRKRYAQGEINKEELEEKKRALLS